MTVKIIEKATPPYPFEQYSHLVSPISAENGGGFMFTMPDIPGVLADGATELEAIADGREAFLATVSALMDMKQAVPAPIFTFNCPREQRPRAFRSTLWCWRLLQRAWVSAAQYHLKSAVHNVA